MIAILLSMFGVSTCVQLFKNNLADHAIERGGSAISPDKRSTTEQISTFLKKYFYLVVPGLNIIKALKLFIKDDIEYANIRKSELDICERISKADAAPKDDSAKPALPQRTNKPSINISNAQQKTTNQSQTKVLPRLPRRNNNIPASINSDDLASLCYDVRSAISSSSDVNVINALRLKYGRIDLSLREEYKNPNLDMESRRKLANKISCYDSIIVSANNRLEELNSMVLTRR